MSSHRKHGFRALGLSFVAVLGLMAYMATIAHAVDTKLWDELVGGVRTEVPNAAGFHASAVGEFLFLVPAKELTIHCNRLVVDDGLLFGTGNAKLGLGLANLLFSECLTLQGEAGGGVLTDQPACDPGTTEAKVEFKQILHNGKVYILFFPDGGTEFAKIKFPVGCALPNNIAVTGSIVAQCLEPLGTPESCAAAYRLTHNISEAPEALFEGAPNNDILKYGTSRALLDGTAAVLLNSDNTWRGWF